jgi:hypothetical protein
MNDNLRTHKSTPKGIPTSEIHCFYSFSGTAVNIIVSKGIRVCYRGHVLQQAGYQGRSFLRELYTRSILLETRNNINISTELNKEHDK